MYGGNSGYSGIVVYNTDVKGDNAVYGYYIDEEMRFETGTKEAMTAAKKSWEEKRKSKDRRTAKIMGIGVLAALAAVVSGFVLLPLRFAMAVLVLALLGYIPLMIILVANSRLYDEEEVFQSFRRFHGCEHAILSALTKKKECTLEGLKKSRIYDTECGTAYAGYGLFLALVIAVLIAAGLGFLLSIGIIFACAVLILIMILVPQVNPFTLLQHPVVARPTDREYLLGLEIMKRVKELK